MRPQGLVVIDIGKTTSKAVLCAADGAELVRRERLNPRLERDGVAVLDVHGIEAWLGATLREFASMETIGTIVPVAHGAAAAIVRGGALAMAPLDYEQPLPPEMRALYAAQRDPFAATGSPLLPDGLNLGAQLHLAGALRPGLVDEGAMILLWPQYWAWRLTGVMASELSSLGCHTDLWRPLEGGPSALARRRGWADRLPPVHPAGKPLGRISDEWVARTGLARDVQVLCGVHDSNAALHAARGLEGFAEGDATVLSTGTWFVAMRSLGPGCAPEPLPEGRDCLFNVDVQGRPVPSARFMGGREIHRLLDGEALRIDTPELQDALVAAIGPAIAGGAMVAPTLAPGAGPYPAGEGRWIARPEDPLQRGAAAALYAALVADAALDLLGARERLLVEGRFSRVEPFMRALATLRPDTGLFCAAGPMDLVFGACRLANPALRPPCALRAVAPLDIDIGAYRARWRRDAAKDPRL